VVDVVDHIIKPHRRQRNLEVKRKHAFKRRLEHDPDEAEPAHGGTKQLFVVLFLFWGGTETVARGFDDMS
jgi:hypothetical protein